jgi:serine/threonine-protein kinase
VGTLSANSIPISSVIVDGRPVGTTPVQIPAAPGTHSVVFVHPTLGRKNVTVEVTSGKPAIAAVRF